MDLNYIIPKINAMNNFIPSLPNRRTYIDDYCKRHPYFKDAVEKITSMYRYVDFNEVLDLMKNLISRFIENLDLINHDKYIFIHTGNSKSGFYFTLLFFKYLSDVLDIEHWDKILMVEYSHDIEWNSKYQYVLVDDGAYSGRQILGYANRIPNPMVILLVASQNAYDLLKYVRGIILLVGRIEPNVFEIDIDDIFRDLDIFYESDGIVQSLLVDTLCKDYDYNAVSGFYFQHKHPDGTSIPQCLVKFPNPSNVRILTLEERYCYIGKEYGSYVSHRDYQNLEDINREYCSLIPDAESFTPFYSNIEYSGILGE